jgi:O-antigen/teichoic acid export membrane protein
MTAATRYAVALYAVRILTLAKAAVLARFLGPQDYGVVAAFATFLAYATFLDVGLFNGQNREIPVLRGARDDEAAHNVSAVVRTGVSIVAIGASAVLAICALAQALGWVGGNWWFTGALAVTVLAQQSAGTLNSLCYAEQRFILQARALTIAAAVDILISVPAVIIWGAPGVIGLAPAMFVVQWIVFRRGFGRIPWRFDLALARKIALIGLPIAVVWFSNTNLIGVDKLVILWRLGIEDLGLYSIAAVSGVMVTIGPNAVSQMLQPRILHRFGEEGIGAGSISLVRSGQVVAGVVAGGLVAVGCALAPAAVATLLPTYLRAVPAAVVLMIASAVLCTITPVVGYFIIHERQMRLAGAYMAASFFNIGIDLVLIRVGYGIVGVAFGSLVTYFLLYVVVQLWLMRMSNQKITSLKGLRSMWTPVLGAAYGCGLGLAAYTFSQDGEWLTGGVATVVVGAALVPLFLVVAKSLSSSSLGAV